MCLTLCDPMNCSPPGFSVHGILQARILEWAAFPSPGDLPHPGIKPRSLALQADSLPSEPPATVKKMIDKCFFFLWQYWQHFLSAYYLTSISQHLVAVLLITHLILQQPLEENTVIIFIVQMKTWYTRSSSNLLKVAKVAKSRANLCAQASTFRAWGLNHSSRPLPMDRARQISFFHSQIFLYILLYFKSC